MSCAHLLMPHGSVVVLTITQCTRQNSQHCYLACICTSSPKVYSIQTAQYVLCIIYIEIQNSTALAVSTVDRRLEPANGRELHLRHSLRLKKLHFYSSRVSSFVGCNRDSFNVEKKLEHEKYTILQLFQSKLSHTFFLSRIVIIICCSYFKPNMCFEEKIQT